MGGGSADKSQSRRRTCKCCVPSEGLRRGAWSAQEDIILTSYINTHGEGKWRQLPQKAGLRRCGRSCRLRWLNYLRHDIKRGNISEDEEDLIIRLHKLLGNRWSLIAGRLPGRTDNEIKNYWNTHLIKKLQGETAKKKSSTSKTKKVNKGISAVKLDNHPHSDHRAEATGCNNSSSPRPEGNQINSNNLELVWDGENSIPLIDEPLDFLNELCVSDFLNSEFLQVHGDHEIQVANDDATGSGDGVKNTNSSCSHCCSGGSSLPAKLIEEDSTNAAKRENGTSKLNVQLSSTWELNSLYSFLGLEDEI